MNRYEPALPRATLGMTAVAMATITMVVLVALPAKLESVSDDRQVLAAVKIALGSVRRAAI